MKAARTSNQKRSSTPIAIGFVVIVALCLLGSRWYTERALENKTFPPAVPGNVNIVGIDPGAGYQIIVANRMAQLVEAEGGFEGKESDSGGATSGSIKRRIPIKEMLDVLRGDGKALGPVVMKLNDMSENENWPSVRVVWTAENLKKAFAGDAALKDKLESDLNVHLDGTPLPRLRLGSLADGIILDYPVSVQVLINGKLTTVTGRVQEPFKPKFCQNVEADYKDKMVTQAMILGYYASEAQQLAANPQGRENIEKSISNHLSQENADHLVEAPERILKSARVVINDSYITGASIRKYDTTRGVMFDLTVELNEEGRMRLWKYSHDYPNTHLLLVEDGIPIAAPIINDELREGELTITQMQDETLANDAADILNHKSNGTEAKK